MPRRPRFTIRHGTKPKPQHKPSLKRRTAGPAGPKSCEQLLHEAHTVLKLTSRLARIANSSQGAEDAKEAVCKALMEAYAGVAATVVSATGPHPGIPPRHVDLARAAVNSCRLVYSNTPGMLELAIPVKVGKDAEALVLSCAADAAPPSVGVLRYIADYIGLAVTSAANYRRATVDGLTGLYSKQYGADKLAHACRVAQRYNQPLSVLIIDIDFFKQVNDTYGHAVGDSVLQTVAQVLRSVLRQTDTPIRFGGEEFLVLLPHTTAAQARVVAEKARHAIAASPIALPSGDSLQVTISVGLATLHASDTPLDVLKRADLALYDAKAGGRNQVRERS